MHDYCDHCGQEVVYAEKGTEKLCVTCYMDHGFCDDGPNTQGKEIEG